MLHLCYVGETLARGVGGSGEPLASLAWRASGEPWRASGEPWRAFGEPLASLCSPASLGLTGLLFAQPRREEQPSATRMCASVLPSVRVSIRASHSNEQHCPCVRPSVRASVSVRHTQMNSTVRASVRACVRASHSNEQHCPCVRPSVRAECSNLARRSSRISALTSPSPASLRLTGRGSPASLGEPRRASASLGEPWRAFGEPRRAQSSRRALASLFRHKGPNLPWRPAAMRWEHFATPWPAGPPLVTFWHPRSTRSAHGHPRKL
eukprot:gene10046-biopygen6372